MDVDLRTCMESLRALEKEAASEVERLQVAEQLIEEYVHAATRLALSRIRDVIALEGESSFWNAIHEQTQSRLDHLIDKNDLAEE